MKLLKNGTWRYRNCTVAPTPLGKYPDMVTVIKAPARMKQLRGKKFLNLKFTKLAIENAGAESLIASGEKSVDKQLEAIALGNLMRG